MEATKKMQNQLLKKAFDLGAKDAIVFEIKDVVFDSRTLLKCLFGCEGGFPFCPSVQQDITIAEKYTEMAKAYKWGILLSTENVKEGQEITLELERAAFLSGYYFALACTECEACSVCHFQKTGTCLNPKKVRLPLYVLGIDVYKTVRGLGWELEVVQDKLNQAKNMTAVFVE